jgi:hypothetical protein
VSDWCTCYSAATPPEAHVVKGFLEQRGVPVLLRSNGPSVYPATALGLGVRVLVPNEWLPVATKLVANRTPEPRPDRPAPVLPLRPRRGPR